MAVSLVQGGIKIGRIGLNKSYPALYLNVQSVPRSKHTPSRL